MPTYQYSCQACGAPFEKRLRMMQASQKQDCPSCGSDQTRKRISAVAVSGTVKFGSPAAAPAVSSPFS